MRKRLRGPSCAKGVIFSDNRHPPRITSGAGFFGIMHYGIGMSATFFGTS